jgi:hypothetical protein
MKLGRPAADAVHNASASPVPETGCGCGVRVPTFTSASHAHKLTVTELDDIRVVATVDNSNSSSPPYGNNDVNDTNSRALVVVRNNKNRSSSALVPPFVISHPDRSRPPSPIYSSSHGAYCNNLNSSNIGNGNVNHKSSRSSGNINIHEEAANAASIMSQLPLSLECDYDVRPTELYKHIQAKSWDQVMELLETDKAIEASVWVVRKEPSGQLRYDKERIDVGMMPGRSL